MTSSEELLGQFQPDLVGSMTGGGDSDLSLFKWSPLGHV